MKNLNNARNARTYLVFARNKETQDLYYLTHIGANDLMTYAVNRSPFECVWNCGTSKKVALSLIKAIQENKHSDFFARENLNQETVFVREAALQFYYVNLPVISAATALPSRQGLRVTGIACHYRSSTISVECYGISEQAMIEQLCDFTVEHCNAQVIEAKVASKRKGPEGTRTTLQLTFNPEIKIHSVRKSVIDKFWWNK